MASATETVVGERNQRNISESGQRVTSNAARNFTCSYCSLKEYYDYKGTSSPFARQLSFTEECYIMKDPFNPPYKGKILVLGGDCSVCKCAVCLGCSVFYTRRFCRKCAITNLQNLPVQLHNKIENLTERADMRE